MAKAKARTTIRKATAELRAVEGGYQPEPYTAEPDETVVCPDCARMNDADAQYCDQCGWGTLPGAAAYTQDDDDDVRCPSCDLFDAGDAEYCDQCGIRLEGRTDVMIEGTASPGTSGLASAKPPRHNLVRARIGAGVELRDVTPDDPSASPGFELHGIFSEYGTWYEVNSFWEGQFMERMAPGAFTRTMREDRAQMRCTFDHGFDPVLGDKPLGPITELNDTPQGPSYVVPLLDTDYNRDFVVPALRGRLMSGEDVGSQLGASFRFTVNQESWVRDAKPSAFNPMALPERTVGDVTVYEFGPVTYPANPGATAGIRSMSDAFMARLVSDSRFLSRFQARVGPKVAQRLLDAIPDQLRASMSGPKPAAVPPVAVAEDRQARIEQLRRRARALVVIGG